MASEQGLGTQPLKQAQAITPEKWRIAAALAFAGAFNPLPFPLTGLHKVYLGQPFWGGVYFLLGWTQIPRIACCLEGLWYLTGRRQFNFFNRLSLAQKPSDSSQIGWATSEQTQAVATALRELDKLRQEGLISEYEFEQKRRQLFEQIG
ncbi:MAG: SHOCT domain-containing protein [Cyanobacteria bacterium P01_H01_bin.58]